MALPQFKAKRAQAVDAKSAAMTEKKLLRALADYRRVVDLALNHQNITVRTKARDTLQRLRAETSWMVGMSRAMVREKQALDTFFVQQAPNVRYIEKMRTLAEAAALQRQPQAAQVTMIVAKLSWLKRALALFGLASRRDVTI